MVELLETKAFLTGQLELYKIQFAETNNNKYLEVMNDIYKTLKVINRLETTIYRLKNEQVKGVI